MEQIKNEEFGKERLAIEWINLGSSKNVVCETLHVFGDGKFQVNGYSR